MTTRIILDTSIYGKIIEDRLEDKIIEKAIVHKHDLIIYGIKIIRKELRAAPKHSKDRYSLRLALLNLYDALTKNHELEIKKAARTYPGSSLLQKLQKKWRVCFKERCGE